MAEHLGNDNEVLTVLQLILDELRTARLNKRVDPGFERDYSAYHLPETVYPFGRQP